MVRLMNNKNVWVDKGLWSKIGDYAQKISKVLNTNVNIWEEITCPHCGSKFMIKQREGNIFCPNCGKQIKKYGSYVGVVDANESI